MIISFIRGHEVYFNEVDDRWHYSDDNSLVPLYNKDTRPCIKCDKLPTKEGYDACLGYLENVSAACCGHGVDEGYTKNIAGDIK